MQFVRRKRKKDTCRNWRKDFFKKENLRLQSGIKTIDCANNNIIITVSIKHGLRTTDCGLGIKYGLGIKRGLENTD